MLLEDARVAVADACRRLRQDGLVVGTAGNVSVRQGDHIAVSPSGLDYDLLTPELVGVHHLEGHAVEAQLAPSSELPLHLTVYALTSAGAIVHNHAPTSTALSTVLDEVPASHYYTAMFGGPVRVAAYATYGTPELAERVAGALDGRTAALMGNHGAITIGDDLDSAYQRIAYLEYVCDVHWRAMATGLPVRALPPDEIARVGERLGSYGQRPPA